MGSATKQTAKAILLGKKTQANVQLADALEKTSWHCFISESFHQATAFGATVPNLVIIDDTTLTSQTLQLLQTLRNSPHFDTLPIIVLGDDSDTQRVVKVLEAGASDYCSNSSDNAVLLARFNSQIRSLNNGEADAMLQRASRGAEGEFVPTPGEMLGHYRLDEVLGIGGMGIVYKATDVDLDRTVAIKILPDDASLQKRHVDRFIREGQIMARLNLPEVVHVLDIGNDPINYLVIEFVKGHDIDHFLEEGVMTPRQAVDIAAKVCRILHKVHQAQVVHRDLKPGNIFLEDNGTLRILDFGISKLLDADVALTVPGSTMGTPAYMSPEQLDSSIAPVDRRTDIYAMGLILYEMIVGEVPFRSEGFVNMIKEIVLGSPMSIKKVIKDIDPKLDAIILKATSKKPEDRYDDALLMAKDLEALDTTMPCYSRVLTEEI